MYSQQDEEKHILAAFPLEVNLGRAQFLDIGAWHPTDKSNTRALYERGWHGVMIEPSPGPMVNLLKEYGNDPRITLVQAAVTADAQTMVKMRITDDATSTSCESVYDTWKERTAYHGSLMVPTITIDQIANRFGGFQFVSIDAEGISVDIFRVMMQQGWRPPCVCVEIDGRDHELAALAEEARYKSVNDLRFGVLGNGTNVVLVQGR
jgi:FkbM family methyltransferase